MRTQSTKSLVDIGFRLSSSARNLPNEQNAEALQRCKIPTLPALDLQTARRLDCAGSPAPSQDKAIEYLTPVASFPGSTFRGWRVPADVESGVGQQNKRCRLRANQLSLSRRAEHSRKYRRLPLVPLLLLEMRLAVWLWHDGVTFGITCDAGEW